MIFSIPLSVVEITGKLLLGVTHCTHWLWAASVIIFTCRLQWPCNMHLRLSLSRSCLKCYISCFWVLLIKVTNYAPQFSFYAPIVVKIYQEFAPTLHCCFQVSRTSDLRSYYTCSLAPYLISAEPHPQVNFHPVTLALCSVLPASNFCTIIIRSRQCTMGIVRIFVVLSCKLWGYIH